MSALHFSESLARRNVLLYLLLQQLQRERSVTQQHIVKVTDIKLRTQTLLGFPAKLNNLELSHLVREGLRRP